MRLISPRWGWWTWCWLGSRWRMSDTFCCCFAMIRSWWQLSRRLAWTSCRSWPIIGQVFWTSTVFGCCPCWAGSCSCSFLYWNLSQYGWYLLADCRCSRSDWWAPHTFHWSSPRTQIQSSSAATVSHYFLPIMPWVLVEWMRMLSYWDWLSCSYDRVILSSLRVGRCRILWNFYTGKNKLMLPSTM